jgi:spore coat polysaccharide biosynthesis protein SpsF
VTFKSEQAAFWAGDIGTEYIPRNQGDTLLASRLDFFGKTLNQARCIRSRIKFGEVIPPANVHLRSILDFSPASQWDLTLIKGVLIHINPEVLPQVYDKLVASTSRCLMLAEYYNPAPVAIPYRGRSDRLFKRDFAGEIMDRHPQLQLVDYGFAYRRDPNFPQDDITWFLMEKR